MGKKLLKRGSIIRGGLAITNDIGYILTCDPRREENSPHCEILLIQQGEIFESQVQFNANSICRIDSPNKGVMVICSEGFYAEYSNAVYTGNIFNERDNNSPEYGSFRSISSIDGQAYGIGTSGLVYRYEKKSSWTNLGKGIDRSFSGQGIAGFSENDIYAVGLHGLIYHFNGQSWRQITTPTNLNFNTVVCGGDGYVYAAGQSGEIICGRNNLWETITPEDLNEDIWGLAWFNETLYASTFNRVIERQENDFTDVDFGNCTPLSYYQLSSGEGTLWSIGEKDVLAFNGTEWKKVV